MLKKPRLTRDSSFVTHGGTSLNLQNNIAQKRLQMCKINLLLSVPLGLNLNNYRKRTEFNLPRALAVGLQRFVSQYGFGAFYRVEATS